MTKFYAGVGSRQTPEPVCQQMTELAVRLHKLGWVCRTGGAVGADQAFEAGDPRAQLYIPWPLYNDRHGMILTAEPLVKACEIAAKFHPAWRMLPDPVRRLHARNVAIMLGYNGGDPVQFVVCWTPGGEIVGGTGMAINIARAKDIPVFNLYSGLDRENLCFAMGIGVS